MFNIKKFNIFQIDKNEMKTDYKEELDLIDERDKAFTFKIIKKRSPWNNEEDHAISVLVNKNGTCNWTLIANEMSHTYGYKHRSGKQCRERWHNHLDPNINKDYWSEKEENILFMRHIEYGNKWSDIAKYLPGRTDNAIKNHFYSKLRKFIRKMLKQLNKENLLKVNSLDLNKYNSDYVYKIIKRNKMPYNILNKETILNLIVNHDKNLKSGKLDGQLLRNKTNRKKLIRNPKREEESLKIGENMYEEKVVKRKIKNESGCERVHSILNRKGSLRKSKHVANFIIVPKETARSKNKKLVVKNYPIEDESRGSAKKENIIVMCKIRYFYYYYLARSKRRLKNSHLKEDFIYEDEHNHYKKRISSFNGDMAKPVSTKNKLCSYVKRNSSTITEDIKDEVVSDDEENSASDQENNSDNLYFYKEEEKKGIENIYFRPYCIPKPIPLSCTNSLKENFIFDDKQQRTFQFDHIGFSDQAMPMISPINSKNLLYPQSTRNHFNFDMTSNDSQSHMHNFNYLKQNKINFNMQTILENSDTSQLHFTPSNKEINLQNKILISESNLVSMESCSTPNFKESKNDIPEVQHEFTLNHSAFQKEKKKNRPMRPSIDLDLINDNEISRLFTESVVNSVKTLNNANSQINFTDPEQYNKDYLQEILNENLHNKDKENFCDDMNYTALNSANLNMNFYPSSTPPKPSISPHNIKAFFNISPKSAFMKIN